MWKLKTASLNILELPSPEGVLLGLRSISLALPSFLRDIALAVERHSLLILGVRRPANHVLSFYWPYKFEYYCVHSWYPEE